jgi:hypothetical protein
MMMLLLFIFIAVMWMKITTFVRTRIQRHYAYSLKWCLIRLGRCLSQRSFITRHLQPSSAMLRIGRDIGWQEDATTSPMRMLFRVSRDAMLIYARPMHDAGGIRDKRKYRSA